MLVHGCINSDGKMSHTLLAESIVRNFCFKGNMQLQNKEKVNVQQAVLSVFNIAPLIENKSDFK